MAIDDDALGEVLDYLGVDLTATDALVATLHPLVAGALGGTSIAEMQRTANEAVAEIWSDELAAELRAELTGLWREDDHDDDFEDTMAAALSEFDRPPAENRLAHALVWRAVADLIERVQRNQDRVAELEDALAETPRAQHRAMALRLAPLALPAVAIDDEAAAEAIAETLGDVAFDPGAREADFRTSGAEFIRALATDERRADMRRSLAGLAEVCADDFPRAAAALRELVAEPVPDDPADDELWAHLVTCYVNEQLDAAMADDFG